MPKRGGGHVKYHRRQDAGKVRAQPWSQAVLGSNPATSWGYQETEQDGAGDPYSTQHVITAQ